MKKSLLLFLLLLAPQLAFAQSGPTKQQKTAQVANLIEKSVSGFLKARTYSGTLDLALTESDGKEMKPVFHAQMRTTYRLDRAGNKIREVTTLSTRINGDNKSTPRTLKVVDDGKTQTQISLESRTYARTPRYNEVATFGLMSSTIKRITSALRRDDLAVSSLSSKTVAGSFTVLESKGGRSFDKLYAIVNDKTGTLETLDYSTGKRGIKIRISNQVFNARLNESQFKWTPPANFKRVAEDQLPNPLQGLAPKPKPTTAPVY